MQKLYGCWINSKRQSATMGDSDRHATNPWKREREPATKGNSERHAETPWK